MQQITPTLTDLHQVVNSIDSKVDSLIQAVGNLTRNVTTMATIMDSHFTSVEQRFNTLEDRIKRLEGNNLALESDIKELYVLTEQLRKDFRYYTKEQQKRFLNLQSFASKVSHKTGISFRPYIQKHQ